MLIAFLPFFYACKYDDSYLNPIMTRKAYFASFTNYNRTVIVGEGLHFKIGAAMSGVTENNKNETVNMIIWKTAPLASGEILMPDSLYNSIELGSTITATIPSGSFLGYFTVKLDSVKFLNNPTSLLGTYVLPVKITGTSLDVIGNLDSVFVSVKYMSGVDGFYLYQTTIKKEINGLIIESKTYSEIYPNESDNSAWRLSTIGPYKVLVTPAVNSILNGFTFNLNVQNDAVVYESLSDKPLIISDGDNVYSKKTRDFQLNYKYKSETSDTIVHVSQKLIFRNRLVDNVNQTRDYLLN